MRIGLWNVVFLAGLAVFLGIRHVFGRRTRANETAVNRAGATDWTLLFMVMVASLLLPILHLFTPWLGFADYHLPAFAPWCGAALMVAALWLFWRSHADLGRNWSVTLELRQGHQLIQHGVYRSIRHPMYASTWLWCFAQGLLLQNWLAGWSAGVAFALLYFVRTPREEQMMGEFFGQEYRDYMLRSGRLFPFLKQERTAQARRRGSYGLDAPYLLPIPVLLIVLNIVSAIASRSVWPLVAAAIITASVGCGLYASRRGKFVVWADLLNQIGLRGDERVLDLGCGRGAVLLMAAQRLSTGRAMGVDLWKKKDQSGNAAEATQRNAVAEGVTDRVELHTADMTDLPFEDGSFDLVVSNVAIHNLSGPVARHQAMEEAVRVLRQGGRLMIADIFATGQYQTSLAALGMTDIKRRGLGWRLWWGGPWMPTYLVTATKPKFEAGTSAA